MAIKWITLCCTDTQICLRNVLVRLRHKQVDAVCEMQILHQKSFASSTKQLVHSKGSLPLEEVILTVCEIELAASHGSTPSKHHQSSHGESFSPQSRSRD